MKARKFKHKTRLQNGTVLLEKLASLPFKCLPPDVKRFIVEKLDFVTWTRLGQCSAESKKICDSVQLRFPLLCTEIELNADVQLFKYRNTYHKLSIIEDSPCRIEANRLTIKGSTFTTSHVQDISKIFRKLQTKAVTICFDGELSTDVLSICNLVEILNITIIETLFLHRLSGELFDHPYIKQMKKIEITREARCVMSDKQFLSLNATTIVANGNEISNESISQLFKEWHAGKREIDRLRIWNQFSNIDRSAVAILSGIEANLEWSPEWHAHSVLANIPIEEFLAEDAGQYSYYIMWRPGDILSTFSLRIGKENVIFGRGVPKRYFHEFLTNYEFLEDECVIPQ